MSSVFVKKSKINFDFFWGCDLVFLPAFAGSVEQFRTLAQESYLRNNLAIKPSAYQRQIIKWAVLSDAQHISPTIIQ
jgi:hypothetical protein